MEAAHAAYQPDTFRVWFVITFPYCPPRIHDSRGRILHESHTRISPTVLEPRVLLVYFESAYPEYFKFTLMQLTYAY